MKKTYESIPATLAESDFQEAVERLEDIKRQSDGLAEEKARIVGWLASQLALDPDAEGSHTYKCGGKEVKVQCKLTRTIDEDKLRRVVTENHLEAIADMTFRWKPSLSLTAYKTLAPDVRELFDEAITSKPAAPYITINQLEEDKQ
ncbi:MAG: hypothetical protein SPF89_07605 [Sphaerochaetaceae bacterium]|nr:hypothetical protein [Spirochaetales bacterium]MDY5499952.1 hypothetical protein [Sphaerochaetaceae bacterium]